MKLKDIHESEVDVVCCDCCRRFDEGELDLMSENGQLLTEYQEDYVEACPHCGGTNIADYEDSMEEIIEN